MAEPETIADAIEENAKGPASASVDGLAATAHNLKDQIEADRYLAGKTAAARNHGGISFRKIDSPAAG